MGESKFKFPETDDWHEDRDSIYNEEGREHLLEDGELSPEEEGFMHGYEEAS